MPYHVINGDDSEGDVDEDTPSHADEDSDDGESMPRHKRARTSGAANGTTSKRPPLKPRLPEAGAFNPEYDIRTHGVPTQTNKRKDLNIQREYGTRSFWPVEAGLRELLQNTWDGCVAFMRSKRRDATAEDIEVCILVDGEPVPRKDPLAEEPLGDLEDGVVVTFLFRVKKTLARPPCLPRPPITARQREDALQEGKRPRSRRSRFERRGDCGAWSDDRLLGWVSFRSGKEQCVDIELFNVHKPLTLATMTFGASTKAEEVETIGEWGDGMKMVSKPHPADVHYITGNVQWDFAYNDEKSLEVRETKANIPFVPGVLVRIVDFPSHKVDLKKFLFLSPPKQRLAAKRGTIILDKALAKNVYVKGIHVTTMPDLVYGVDIRTNMPLSRDRSGLQSEFETADTIFHIWAELFPSSRKARDLYIDLLLAKSKPVEVIAASYAMTTPHLKRLWKQLRNREGDVFFCLDNSSQKHITKHILCMRPYPLNEPFWALLNRRQLIQSPDAARAERFGNLPPSPVRNSLLMQVQFTFHLIEAFRCLEKNARQCNYEFKAAPPRMDVEVVNANGVILLNDFILSPAYIHQKHPQCPSYQRYQESLADDEQHGATSLRGPPTHNRFPDVGSAFICHCAAFHVLAHLDREMAVAGQENRQEARQTALQTLPRDVVFQITRRQDAQGSDVPMDIGLSWRTWSSVSKFLVTVSSDVTGTSRLVHDVENGVTQAATAALPPTEGETITLIFSRTFECKNNTLCLTDLVPRGQKYAAQVCSNKKGSLYSLPLYFTVPASPPRSASIAVVQHLPDQLLVTWTANPDADGADSWIVVVRHGERELLRKEVSTPTLDTRVEDLPTDISSANVSVHVYAKSAKLDGLTSTDCASWPCQKTNPSPALPEADEEMAYADNERTVGDGAHDIGNAGQNEDREQTPENIAELVIPTYDELVAKPSLSSSDEKTYINVNVRWITVDGNKKKLTTRKYFIVSLQGADGRRFEGTMLYIHSIGVPDDPGPDDEDVVVVSQYIPRDRIQSDAPPNEFLRICHPQHGPAESSHFRLSDILDVHSEAIPVSDLDVVAEVGGDRFCKATVHPVLACGATPPALPTLEFGELLSGTGNASLGFRQAGFNNRFAVECDVSLASAFSMNSRTPVFKESTEHFFSRSWAAKPMLQYPFAALLVNCDTRNGRTIPKDILIKCIEEFRPAYADMNRGKLYDMTYKAMTLGYCLKWQVLDSADFGVAAHKKYLVVFASAPGREMPDFPRPKTSRARTLEDAISDLEWDNATCRPSGKGFATEFPHLAVDQRQALSWHCTGCYLPDVTSWDPDVTVAKWDEPLPDTFLLPSETVKCRHPHHPERFLSVREMARILGVSDEWEFTGSLREQYSQLASAMPALLSQAIAEELGKVLVMANPRLA
ncbi:hypothetical protein BDZ89DRAFT_1073585 [Hymenopellis radicata]|nr:hypothetical protein BDZ89DRAFT_1073585 [Hymenopellis radicata]